MAAAALTVFRLGIDPGLPAIPFMPDNQADQLSEHYLRLRAEIQCLNCVGNFRLMAMKALLKALFLLSCLDILIPLSLS